MQDEPTRPRNNIEEHWGARTSSSSISPLSYSEPRSSGNTWSTTGIWVHQNATLPVPLWMECFTELGNWKYSTPLGRLPHVETSQSLHLFFSVLCWSHFGEGWREFSAVESYSTRDGQSEDWCQRSKSSEHRLNKTCRLLNNVDIV